MGPRPRSSAKHTHKQRAALSTILDTQTAAANPSRTIVFIRRQSTSERRLQQAPGQRKKSPAGRCGNANIEYRDLRGYEPEDKWLTRETLNKEVVEAYCKLLCQSYAAEVKAYMR